MYLRLNQFHVKSIWILFTTNNLAAQCNLSKVVDIVQSGRVGPQHFTDGGSEFPATDHVDERPVNCVDQGQLSDVRSLKEEMNNEKLGSNFHPDKYLRFRRFSIKYSTL
jgi:hypothetical protein